MTIEELIIEALTAKERFWFVEGVKIVERTDSTVTLHFIIAPKLFIQIFFSQRSKRFSLALVGNAGRLYGRDREHGVWHRHPFGHSQRHELTPEGMSPQPVFQFLTEVQDILLANSLI